MMNHPCMRDAWLASTSLTAHVCRYPLCHSDIIAQAAQITIFVSLLASVVTNLDPENLAMATLLPLLLGVPVGFTAGFSLTSVEDLRSLFLPNEDGKYSCVGRVVLNMSRVMTAGNMEAFLAALCEECSEHMCTLINVSEH